MPWKGLRAQLKENIPPPDNEFLARWDRQMESSRRPKVDPRTKFPVNYTHETTKFFAVARGRQPGIYESWEGGAQDQTHCWPDPAWASFFDRGAAIEYMLSEGIPKSEIRIFREAFKPLPNFEPCPTASFDIEFERFASSQRLTGSEKKKAKVDAIRNALIQFCLPDGTTADQEDEWEGIILTEEQTLKIYQKMCSLAGKNVHKDIDECMIELKSPPYVNIIDFIDTYRTEEEVPTFRDWKAFKRYTLRGKTIDVGYARENEFLAPLMQNFRKPPCIDPRRDNDPRPVRARLIRERNERMQNREIERRKKLPVSQFSVLGAIVEEAGHSPAASDFSPASSRSCTPELENATPDTDHDDANEYDGLTPESPSPAPISLPVINLPQEEEYEHPEFPSSQLPPPSSQMEERHWTQASQLGKRTHDSPTKASSPRKRTRRTELETLQE